MSRSPTVPRRASLHRPMPRSMAAAATGNITITNAGSVIGDDRHHHQRGGRNGDDHQLRQHSRHRAAAASSRPMSAPPSSIPAVSRTSVPGGAAISLGTGNNTLSLTPTSSITGLVTNGITSPNAVIGVNTLNLSGTGNGTFDVSQIGRDAAATRPGHSTAPATAEPPSARAAPIRASVNSSKTGPAPGH